MPQEDRKNHDNAVCFSQWRLQNNNNDIKQIGESDALQILLEEIADSDTFPNKDWYLRGLNKYLR